MMYTNNLSKSSIHIKRMLHRVFEIQLYFNGSNTFGTMIICSRQGEFELMSVNHCARSGGIIGMSFRFSLHEGILCVLIRIASSSTHYAPFSIYKRKSS